MNFLTLGNALPHLHTHLFPRYVDDPAPERPLPWDLVDDAAEVEETAFRHQLGELRRLARREATAGTRQVPRV